MGSICANSEELCEVVYFPEVGKPKDGIHLSGWTFPILAGLMIGLAAWWFNSHLPLVISDAIEKKNQPIETRLTKVETFLKLTSKDASSVIGQIPKLLRDTEGDAKALAAALEVTAEVSKQAGSEGKESKDLAPVVEAGNIAIESIPKVAAPAGINALQALISYRTTQNGSQAPNEANYPADNLRPWRFELPL